MGMNHLPDDLIVEILLRLPPKYLFRCSCVSKKWHSIIFSDPKFAQTHRTLKCRLLLSTSSQLGFILPSYGDSLLGSSLTCGFKKPGDSLKILGACHGLLCVACAEYQADCNVPNESLFREYPINIWNPSTGFFRKLPCSGMFRNLPDSDISRQTNLYRSHYRYHGFGYSSATDDYKLISAINIFNEVELAVFSFRNNFWKKIAAPSHIDRYQYMECRQGTLLNEALHWLPKNVLPQEFILAFDLATDEFRVVPLPVFEGRTSFQYIGVVEGCLCVSMCKYDIANDSVNFWIMREYDVRESWTPLFKLKIFDSPTATCSFKPIFVSESGIVVVNRHQKKGDMELIRFDKEEKKVDDDNDKVAVPSGRWKLTGSCDGFYDAVEYEESLLSLDHYDGLEVKKYNGNSLLTSMMGWKCQKRKRASLLL